MRLYLVRHGQTSWNIIGRAQGHTDIGLDTVGLEQAQQLGRAFDGIPIRRIYCSDLARCTETAGPLASTLGITPEFRKDLRERGFGQWEGMQFAEVAKRINAAADAAGVSPQTIRPPGGESFEDVWHRLESFCEFVRRLDEPSVIVSHGGALSLFLAKLILGTLDTCRSFRFPNAGITELERRPEGPFMINRYGDTSHLARERLLGGT